MDPQSARLDSVELIRFKKEIKCLTGVLRKKERLLAMITGFMDAKRWMVCCTQSRIIFLFQLQFAEPETVEIPLENIVAVENRLGIIFGEITIIEDTKKTIIKNVAKKKTKVFAETVSEAVTRRKKVKAAASPVEKQDLE